MNEKISHGLVLRQIEHCDAVPPPIGWAAVSTFLWFH